jgi:hypothetical protein
VAKNQSSYEMEFAFFEQLKHFYRINRGKVRSRYNDLTKKFLTFNDSEDNPNAFLRKPQFEALEMYVFIKEFMENKQVYEIFDEWRKREGAFADTSYYTIHNKDGQISLFEADEAISAKMTDTLFKQIKNYRESYPYYIYALTMGLGSCINIVDI